MLFIIKTILLSFQARNIRTSELAAIKIVKLDSGVLKAQTQHRKCTVRCPFAVHSSQYWSVSVKLANNITQGHISCFTVYSTATTGLSNQAMTYYIALSLWLWCYCSDHRGVAGPSCHRYAIISNIHFFIIDEVWVRVGSCLQSNQILLHPPESKVNLWVKNWRKAW